jgi:hypothetical protein
MLTPVCATRAVRLRQLAHSFDCALVLLVQCATALVYLEFTVGGRKLLGLANV